MNSEPEWLSPESGDVIPLRLAGGGLYVAIIRRDPTLRSQVVFVPPDLMRPYAPSLEIYAGKIRREIEKSGDAPEVRLIGRATEIDLFNAQVSGFRLGRPVLWENPEASLYFYPITGKIRVPTTGNPKDRSRKKRVLVIDDSVTICKLLRRIIDDAPDLECIGAIHDPKIAKKEIRAMRPDVVTMDIHMPDVSGIELVRRVMQSNPSPIVLISSLSMSEGGEVLEGLALGAVDYIQKPTARDLKDSVPQIQDKIRAASTARVRRPANVISRADRGAGVPALDLSSLILIGASTGGTEAIREVLASFPARIPAVLVVQHIPEVFSKAFAARLNGMFSFRVKEAIDSESVEAGTVYIAPGGKQMRLQRSSGGFRLGIDESEPVNRHRPSVDALFASVAELKHPKVSACVLTGMGADGAREMVNLRKGGRKDIRPG